MYNYNTSTFHIENKASSTRRIWKEASLTKFPLKPNSQLVSRQCYALVYPKPGDIHIPWFESASAQGGTVVARLTETVTPADECGTTLFRELEGCPFH